MNSQYSVNNEIARVMRRRAGDYVKGLRIDAGLTQAQVARALGYEYYTMISQVENGRGRVPPEDYPAWAQVLGVDLATFAKTLLSYVDPFTHHAIFGGPAPLLAAQREATKHAKAESRLQGHRSRRSDSGPAGGDRGDGTVRDH